MSEHEFDLALLREVRDIGVTQPDAQRLSVAVAAAVAREAAGVGRRRWAWRLPRLGGPGLLVPSVGVAVAIAVAVVAFVGLGSHNGATFSGGQAQGLLDRLSVLRRPQTPADRLPSPLHLNRNDGNGQIVHSLTRLVASPPGARMYLVVTRPPSGDGPPIWSPKLGDQVSIITLTPDGKVETPGQPAVDLSDGLEVQDVVNSVGGRGRVVRGDRPSASSRRARVLYRVGVVPDGVARATWRYRVMRLVRGFAEPTARTVIVHPRIVGNIAYAPGARQLEQLVGVNWYAADGSRIATSATALRHAVVHRQELIRLRSLREVEHNTYHANPKLLGAFAVFGVTSPTGVVLSDGVRVSDPPIDSLPFTILNWLEPNDTVTEPDPHAVRQITMPSGIQFYVIAGARGLCAGGVDHGDDASGNPALAGLSGGGGEGCSGNIADALKNGIGFTSSDAGGSTTYTVRPIGHPYVTIGRGVSRHTLAPADGVYATHEPIQAR
jgi:hypothetical protein